MRKEKTLKQLLNQGPGPSQCHPRVGRTRPPGGCLPRAVLEEAASAAKLTGATAKSDEALRAALEKALGVKSGAEASFVQALPLSATKRAELAKTYLRPPMPAAWKKDPDMWLDSRNIEDVANQHEEANPQFEFMGPFPIDFAAPDPYGGAGGVGSAKRCLMNEMCELRVLDAKKKGTEGIGIIYNLDPHYKSGSHWVATYIDLKRHTCHYFDSYGQTPPHQIATFMRWLAQQDKDMKLHYNSKRLQFKNSECGMFCLMFIIYMQYGVDFLEIVRAAPSDSHMLDLRDWLFST